MEVWMDRVTVWFDRFEMVAIDYLSQNQFLFLLDKAYYAGLWEKYYSVKGFFMGLIFTVLVFLACGSREKTNFTKMVSFIAVINSCSAVTGYLYRLVNDSSGFLIQSTYGFTAADNVLSGFLLTLTVVSCFQGFGGRAFLFGAATFSVLPLMNYSAVVTWEQIVILATRVLIMSVLCTIMSGQTYFYVSWLWYGGFSLLLKVVARLLPPMLYSRNFHLSGLNMLGEYLQQFIPEYTIFVAILGFAILFERLVIKKKKAAA